MPGPSPSAHQVLVYSGPGVSPMSLSHTLLTLSLLLLPHYTVQPITPHTLATEPWEPSCVLLVIPGGRDLPYVEELSMETKVTGRIREFVREGGSYLGICAGAYFGAADIRFDTGGDLEVLGKRDLAFFPGTCAGPTFPGFAYAAESGSRPVSLILDTPSSSSRALDHIYYNGGGHFILPSPLPESVQVLARYAQRSTSSRPSTSPLDELPVAAVRMKSGKGRALLCSVHFEYPLNHPPARKAVSKLKEPPDSELLERSEKARIDWAKEILELLGLGPPGQQRAQKDVEQVGDEEAALLLHPTHPSPIFVLPHPSLPPLGSISFADPQLAERMTEEVGGWKALRDGNDELRVVKTDAGRRGEGGGTENDVTSYLADLRRTPPILEPQLQELSLETSQAAPEPPKAPDFHPVPKTVLQPSSTVPYTPRWTPLFNFETYWSELDGARKRSGRRSGIMRRDVVNGAENAALGDLVWYGETVTSTQTMLDRNPLLLTSLPTPLAFLASFQLTGRGRGSNIWLSPPGCLQFSLLLTLPTLLASKLVFIQYLMALAVCEAVDEDGRLGVRIKWPNDIYAEAEGIGGTALGSGQKGRSKLGGILVNTNYVDGKWRIVVGCGVNILNALPTTSLSQLRSFLTSRQQAAASEKPLPAPPTMEGTFARIMNSLELKWEQFIEENGFDGFMDEYYGRWLHSNQEVTLTTTEPHTRLRILSITPDHGFLRCKPITTSNGLTSLYDRDDYGDGDTVPNSRMKKKDDGFVDLQPDGNSFDLMSGLIKRKV